MITKPLVGGFDWEGDGTSRCITEATLLHLHEESTQRQLKMHFTTELTLKLLRNGVGGSLESYCSLKP